MLFSSIHVLAQKTSIPPYQLKAVFLYNFTQFIEWPPQSFPDAPTPFIIGVLGDNPFGAYLEETVHAENLDGHPLDVKYFANVADARNCHMLYINIQDTNRIVEILNALKKRSVLTVSEAPDFCRMGGMVRFLTENNKIRLQINLEAAKEANLVFSSKLLRLAEIVDSRKR